jgi:hypothetical protein
VTKEMIVFWESQVARSRMTSDDVSLTCRRCIQNLKIQFRLPTWHEFIGQVPRPHDRPVVQIPGGMVGAISLASQMAKSGSWEKFLMLETKKGLERRDMAAAYRAIIAEGERRKQDVRGFRVALAHVMNLRKANEERRARRRKEVSVGEMSPMRGGEASIGGKDLPSVSSHEPAKGKEVFDVREDIPEDV